MYQEPRARQLPARNGVATPKTPEPKPAKRGIVPCARAMREPLIPRAAPCLLGPTLLLMRAVMLAMERPLGIARSGMMLYIQMSEGTKG